MTEPYQTDMGRRWRWDRFSTAQDAAAWYNARKKEGHAVYLRHLAVAWDQSRRPDAAPKKRSYPKTTYDWCRHCGERITRTRTGTGKLDPRPAYRKRGFRDWQYTEREPHSCPGLVAERKAIQASTLRMSKMLGRILRSMK